MAGPVAGAALAIAAGWLWAGCGASVPQLPVVSVAPAAATLQAGGGTQQFTATVTNASNTSVVWKVNGQMGGSAGNGTISTSGLYSAPAAVPTGGTVTVEAVSVANALETAAATVTLTPAVSLTISPTAATVGADGALQFTAVVSNTTNTSVTWSVNGTPGGTAQVGTVSANGLYVAPAMFPGLGQVTVTCTSVADPSISAGATVTLTQPVGVTVTPATVNVLLGATQDFTATVTGNSNQAVTWNVDGIAGGNAGLGTITAQGVFTAPNTMPTPPVETVTAVSQADASKFGAAQVTLQSPAGSGFSLSPASSTLSLGKAQSGKVAIQLSVSPGFTQPITFTVSGLPTNVTGTLDQTTMTASGTVNLTLATSAISLAAASIPIDVTASSTNAGANATQTATVLLTITGWAGNVNTVAGGPGGIGFEDGTGTVDELDAIGITSDGGQNLYFADKRGTALRSYGLVNQTVTTLIGGPYSYTIGEGDGAAYDPGNQTVYVADGLRAQIVAYKLGSGDQLTVVAGGAAVGYADGSGAAAEFDYPHGLVISPDDTTLYVADTNNEVIRAINLASGAVTTLAGQHGVFRSADGTGTAASFCQPTGLAIDPAGANLYVSDACGFVIRQIALPSAQVSTVAGSGTQGQSDGAALSATFWSPGALAVDPHAAAGLLYVADRNLLRAVRLGSNASVFTIAGSEGAGQSDGNSSQSGFYNPGGLTALADIVGANTTTIFVADTDNGLLRRVDITNPLTAASGATALTVTTLAGQPSHRGNTDGAGTGPNYSAASVAEFSQPEGIVTDGKIAYVSDSVNGAVREIDLSSGQVSTIAGPHQGYNDGPGPQASFYNNAGLAWAPSQNALYVADAGNGAIRKIDLSSSSDNVSTIAGTNASGYIEGPGTTARFNNPFGVIVSPDGKTLYVADTGNNAIRAIDLTNPSYPVTTVAGNGGLGHADGAALSATFAEPNGLAWDPTGTILYISDFENEDIRAFNLTTNTVSTVVGSAHQCGYTDGPASTASLCSPAFLASDGYSLFWGDANEGLLRVLNLSTMQVSTLAGSPGVMHMVDGAFTEAAGELTGPVRYNGVFGIAVAPDDSFILFTDKTANVVRIIH